MARIDTISLSGNEFVNIGIRGIDGLTVCNTDTEDVTFDLIIGPALLNKKTTTTDAIFILKEIPVPVGSSFVFDDNGVLSGAFNQGSAITKYEYRRKSFIVKNNFTFLIRVGSGHTADVFLRRG
tara:strand:- start:2255 stop:2626 length:372 start_codon:yes stop_codon:yes gene_type:complete